MKLETLEKAEALSLWRPIYRPAGSICGLESKAKPTAPTAATPNQTWMKKQPAATYNACIETTSYRFIQLELTHRKPYDLLETILIRPRSIRRPGRLLRFFVGAGNDNRTANLPLRFHKRLRSQRRSWP